MADISKITVGGVTYDVKDETAREKAANSVKTVNGVAPDANGNVTVSGGSGGGITTETDPTVPAWAKAATKPTYTAAEVGALPASTVIPTALPTPNKLTFTGAVNAEFDGSKAMTVEIPSGGGGGGATLLATYVLTPSERGINIDMASFGYENLFMEIALPVKTANTTNIYVMNAAAIGQQLLGANSNPFYGYGAFKIVDSCIYGCVQLWNGFTAATTASVNGKTRNTTGDQTSLRIQLYPYVDGDEELTIKIWGCA